MIPAAEGSSRRYDPMRQPALSPIRRAEPHRTGSSPALTIFTTSGTIGVNRNARSAKEPSATASINSNGQTRGHNSGNVRAARGRAGPS